MLTATLPALASLIPPDELARAIRLAFDTLVSLLTDPKTHPRERRLIACTLLRLTATPPSPSQLWARESDCLGCQA